MTMSPCPRNVPSASFSPNSPCARHHDFTFMNTYKQRPPFITHVVVVQLLSHVWLFVTSWTAAHQAFLSSIISQSSLELMSIESVKPSHPLSLPSLLSSIFPSIRVFSSESALHIKWPKYWSFHFSISHSNEYSGLISYRIDRLDLLAVQGTLKSLLQHHSLKARILRHSAFFTVQLSHLYMTTGIINFVPF